MADGLGAWVTSTKNVYVGNATTVRDYRVQLRGSRSVLLFGLYLFILIVVAMWIYSETVSRPNISIVDAQQQLREFTQIVMGLLGLAVSLVAPGLTATTVIMERQRQSLDLVFSAPVSPKYYLVGKIMSSLRYTWMLLVLALPITAASVVLGGASWSDVLVAYLLLSVQGLMMTAVALLMSTIATKPVGAIIWSYAVAIFYNCVMFPLSLTYTVGRMFGGGRGNEAPWYVTLSPFTAMDTGHTFTLYGTHQIPNWIFTVIVSVLVCKVCLLGAGALLSPSGGKEIVGLRVHTLVYVLVIAAIVGWVTAPIFGHLSAGILGPSSPVGPEFVESQNRGQLFAVFTSPMMLFVPFVACFGFDRERRYWPNGVFSVRRLLDGTPGGGLLFILTLIGLSVLGWAIALLNGDHTMQHWPFWAYVFYATAFWVFFWSVGRLISSFFGGLRTSRTMLFAIFLLIVGFPFPFLVAIAGSVGDRTSPGPWDLYILSPLLSTDGSRPAMALTYGAILLVLSIIAASLGEQRVRKKMATVRNYDEQPLQAA